MKKNKKYKKNLIFELIEDIEHQGFFEPMIPNDNEEDNNTLINEDNNNSKNNIVENVKNTITNIKNQEN